MPLVLEKVSLVCEVKCVCVCVPWECGEDTVSQKEGLPVLMSLADSISPLLSPSHCVYLGGLTGTEEEKEKEKEVCAVHYSSHSKRVRASLKKEKSASMCGNTVWDVVPLWTRAPSFSKEARYSFLHPPFPLSKLTTTCVQPPILTTKISATHRSWIKEMMMEPSLSARKRQARMVMFWRV